MSGLIEALAPAFAAGLAVQRFLEILDATGIPFLKGGRKKFYMAGLSLVLAASLVHPSNIRIFEVPNSR